MTTRCQRIPFFSIIFVYFLVTSSLFANGEFPLPPQLEDNVHFWIKIYTQYSKSEVVIHDADHVNIIYEVINLDDYYPRDMSLRRKWHKVEQVKKEYKRILLHFARQRRPIDPDQLTEKERRVYSLWANVDEQRKFAKAARNIRGQKGLREQFLAGLRRSGKYMQKMKQIFHKYDLPEELCFLPHVESSFYYKAYSKMGAAGLWQFTRSTGRLYLKINYSLDERLDPIIATDAAARLLRNNFLELGHWPLAITAYNHGLAGMKKACKRLHTTDMGEIAEKYRSRSFGFASKNFYAEFLAAKEIAENYQRYFGYVNFEKPIEFKEFKLRHYVTLNSLAKEFKIDKELLVALNPAFRRPIIRSQRRIPRGYGIRLPSDNNFDPGSLYAELAETEKFNSQIRDRYYKVQRGDNLSDIAMRYGTSVSRIMELNDLPSPHLIRAGQLIEMPVGNTVAKTAKKSQESPKLLLADANVGASRKKPSLLLAENGTASATVDPPPAPPSTPLLAVLPEHETPQNDDFARSYGPEPPADFFPEEETGTVKSDSAATWGFKVSFEEPKSDWITVQPEETLGHFAEWAGIPAQTIRDLNGLEYGREIHAGQRLELSFKRISPAEFHRRRLEYHRSIQEDFFSNYKISGTIRYSVKPGDNVWILTKRTFDIPYWLLDRYNPNHNLQKLFPRDEIVVPVVQPRTGNDDDNGHAD